MISVSERLQSRIKVSSAGCWEWQGARHRFGYGMINVNGKIVTAHRVSYELHNGSIAIGMSVLHRCDNPPCVNPKHLFVGTQADNNRDMMSKGRARPNYINHAPRGSTHHFAKLTEGDVLRIRESHAQGEKGWELAKKYGVTQTLISMIWKRKIWRHI